MELKQFERALACFAAIEPTHQMLHFAQAFLVLAEHEPCTFRTVGEALNLTNSSVSRIVRALGQTNRKGTPGFGLVYTAKDPKEGRREIVMLTPKGKALLRSLKAA